MTNTQSADNLGFIPTPESRNVPDKDLSGGVDCPAGSPSKPIGYDATMQGPSSRHSPNDLMQTNADGFIPTCPPNMSGFSGSKKHLY